MSMFSHQMICSDCKDLEKHHPEYERAEIEDLRELAERIRQDEPTDIGHEKALAIEATAKQLELLISDRTLRCELLFPPEAEAELEDHQKYDPEGWTAEPHHKIPRWGCTGEVTDLVERFRDGNLPEPVVVWRPVQSGEDLCTWVENAGIAYVLVGDERVRALANKDGSATVPVLEFVGTREQAQAVRVTLEPRTRM
jgi:hypothetical protein